MEASCRNSPDDAIAQGDLGLTLMFAGRRDEAAIHMQKSQELKLHRALEAAPDNAALHNDYGLVLLESGRAAEAQGTLSVRPNQMESRPKHR